MIKKFHFMRMQHHPFGRSSAILHIPDNGMLYIAKMRSDLMCAPVMDDRFDLRLFCCNFQWVDLRYGRLALA